MRHIAFFVAACGLLLGGFTPAHAQIPSVTFTDLTDDTPMVSIMNTTALSVQSSGPEFATVTGSLPNLTPGQKAVLLTEPPSDPFGGSVSDIVILSVSAASPSFTLQFLSDGADGFAAALRTANALNPAMVLETGSSQDISAQLGTSGVLTVMVTSDFPGTVESVPEPSTFALLGLGGLGLLGDAYRRREQAV